MINDVEQTPMEGRSFIASLSYPTVEDAGRAQYVELYGNRGLWQGDWSIVTSHRIATWDWHTRKTFDEPWELYNLTEDLGQTNDLASEYPQRVDQMAQLLNEQAQQYHVFPMHHLNAAADDNREKARQDYLRRGGVWHYPGPVSNITAARAPPVNIQGFTMSSMLYLSRGTETGPIFAYGGQLAGIGLYLQEGRPALIRNSLRGDTAAVSATSALGPGEHAIELIIDKGEVAGDRSAEYRVLIKSGGRVLADEALSFSIAQYFGIPETFGVGEDEGNPVTKGYTAGTPFPGSISDVVFDFSATGPGGSELH